MKRITIDLQDDVYKIRIKSIGVIDNGDITHTLYVSDGTHIVYDGKEWREE